MRVERTSYGGTLRLGSGRALQWSYIRIPARRAWWWHFGGRWHWHLNDMLMTLRIARLLSVRFWRKRAALAAPPAAACDGNDDAT